MLFSITGKGLSLDDELIEELYSFGLIPVYIKEINDNSENLNEIVFDLQPGLEFVDIIDRWDFQPHFIDKIIKFIKQHKKYFCSFVSEESIASYNALRDFNDDEGLIFRIFLKGGTTLKISEHLENGLVLIEGKLELHIINKSNEKKILYQLEGASLGFRLEDLRGNEILSLKGEELEKEKKIEIKTKEKYSDEVDFFLKIPKDFYKLVVFTSSFKFSEEDKGIKFWQFAPINIRIE
ncbi:MAG: hypothetical protein ACP6IY_06555 [Promethearchaeia archaeon]